MSEEPNTENDAAGVEDKIRIRVGPGTPVIIRGGSLAVELINLAGAGGSKDNFGPPKAVDNSQVLNHSKDKDIHITSIDIYYSPPEAHPPNEKSEPLLRLKFPDPNGHCVIKVNTE